MSSAPRYLQNSIAYRLLGTPSILLKSSTGLVWFFVVLFLILLFTPWQQTAVGDGRVMAFAPGDRVQMITANVEGRVAKWYAREGDRVKEGDLLAKVVDNDPEIITRLQTERAALVRQIKALEFNVTVAGKNRERQKKLFDEGIASEFAFEQAQMAQARAQKDLADAEGKLAQIDVRISRQMTQEVRAPRDGVVQSILVGENSALVKSGDVIARLVPETDERTVELYVNGLDLPFIRVGQEVRLQFEGWPVLQFAGLPELSTGLFVGQIRIIDASDTGGGNFRVIVSKKDDSTWPGPELLRQGVRARGWVQMNQVPLWFEIWRLINDLPPFEVPLNQGDAKKVSSAKDSGKAKEKSVDNGKDESK